MSAISRVYNFTICKSLQNWMALQYPFKQRSWFRYDKPSVDLQHSGLAPGLTRAYSSVVLLVHVVPIFILSYFFSSLTILDLQFSSEVIM